VGRSPSFLQVGDVAGAAVGSFALRFRAKWLAVQPGIEIRQENVDSVGQVARNINSISVVLGRSYWAGRTGPVVLGMESR
jgi:hypothetical protein